MCGTQKKLHVVVIQAYEEVQVAYPLQGLGYIEAMLP